MPSPMAVEAIASRATSTRSNCSRSTSSGRRMDSTAARNADSVSVPPNRYTIPPACKASLRTGGRSVASSASSKMSTDTPIRRAVAHSRISAR